MFDHIKRFSADQSHFRTTGHKTDVSFLLAFDFIAKCIYTSGRTWLASITGCNTELP